MTKRTKITIFKRERRETKIMNILKVNDKMSQLKKL